MQERGGQPAGDLVPPLKVRQDLVDGLVEYAAAVNILLRMSYLVGIEPDETAGTGGAGGMRAPFTL